MLLNLPSYAVGKLIPEQARPSRACGLLTLLVAGTVFAASARGASQLWPNAFTRFFSEDLSPVHVTVLGYGTPMQGNDYSFAVPRAWIIFTADYSPLKIDRIPDPLATKSLGLSFIGPSGEALSIRSRRLARELGISWSEALKQLRSETYEVRLIPVSPEITSAKWRDRFAWGGSLNAAPEADKLDLGDVVLERKSGIYFSKTGGEFTAIHCPGDGNPISYCDYYVRLSRHLIGAVTFFDFRFHGGIEYANARVRSARDILCRQDTAFCPDLSSDYR